jgi:hypothetical protein
MPNNEASPSVDDRSAQFVAVTGTAETTSAEALVFAAYLTFWFFVFFLVWRTWRGQTQLKQQFDRLEARLNERLNQDPNP